MMIIFFSRDCWMSNSSIKDVLLHSNSQLIVKIFWLEGRVYDVRHSILKTNSYSKEKNGSSLLGNNTKGEIKVSVSQWRTRF